jgi:hypothetical protein
VGTAGVDQPLEEFEFWRFAGMVGMDVVRARHVRVDARVIRVYDTHGTDLSRRN